MTSLWKRDQLALRGAWSKSMNPKLDKKAGPLEITRGITWRSAMKYNFFLMGLAGVIGYVNNRAYQQHSEKKRSTAERGMQQVKQDLKAGAEDKVKLSPREKLLELHEKVKRETDDWNEDQLRNVKIPRPAELTLENLREGIAHMPLSELPKATQDQLEELKKKQGK